VFQGTAEDAAPVFEEFWPGARGVADTHLALYHAFGLRRGTLGQMLSPRVWKRAWEARKKGYRQSKAVTDARLMPGAFLVHGRRITWQHAYAHVGDSPDFSSLRNVYE